MKRGIQWVFLFLGLLLYACGGNGHHSNHSSNAKNSASIDVTKPSTSKGIGAFKAVELPNEVDKQKAAKGKSVFQNNCIACHQIGTQATIGPGLKNVTKIRTPEWILNMITNPDEMLQKDPLAKALLKKFGGTRMTNQGITKEEARDILAYLRQNDS